MGHDKESYLGPIDFGEAYSRGPSRFGKAFSRRQIGRGQEGRQDTRAPSRQIADEK